MKTKILWIIGGIATVVGLYFGVNSFLNYNYVVKARAAEKRVEQETALSDLSEKEKDYWIQVYSEAVRRGVWYPARSANAAILELRKISGEKND